MVQLHLGTKTPVWAPNVLEENLNSTPHSHLLLFGLLCLVIVEDLFLLIQLLESSTTGKRRNKGKAALKQQTRKLLQFSKWQTEATAAQKWVQVVGKKVHVMVGVTTGKYHRCSNYAWVCLILHQNPLLKSNNFYNIVSHVGALVSIIAFRFQLQTTVHV